MKVTIKEAKIKTTSSSNTGRAIQIKPCTIEGSDLELLDELIVTGSRVKITITPLEGTLFDDIDDYRGPDDDEKE